MLLSFVLDDGPPSADNDKRRFLHSVRGNHATASALFLGGLLRYRVHHPRYARPLATRLRAYAFHLVRVASVWQGNATIVERSAECQLRRRKRVHANLSRVCDNLLSIFRPVPRPPQPRIVLFFTKLFLRREEGVGEGGNPPLRLREIFEPILNSWEWEKEIDPSTPPPPPPHHPPYSADNVFQDLTSCDKRNYMHTNTGVNLPLWFW